LLVDEDDSVLEAVGAVLLEREHAVETVRSAADAMALLERKEFDLVIADLDLVGMTGRNLLHDWIIARRPGLTKRCLWMRGAAPLGKSPDEASSYANQILQKPFKAAELLAAVDAALAGVQTAPVEG
jgi:DNA-binding NtrC family response regulator